jgi:hypothetical protein
MNHNRRHSRWEDCFYWIVMLSACAISSRASELGACYNTPRAAVDSSKPGSVISPMSQGGGYRVMSVQSDVVLKQRWAFIARCDHPEWPVSALQISGFNSLLPPRESRQISLQGISAIPVVHAGDVVLLWKQEDLLRIEVAGISEESGGLGNTIRVRLLHKNTDEQSVHEQFTGIIRGPSDVEMKP